MTERKPILTPRQREYLALMASGHQQAGVALLCDVSIRTVENQLLKARARTEANTTLQCAVRAIAREELFVGKYGECKVDKESLRDV